MEAEVQKVKKEYEERQRKKKEESEKSKDKDKDETKDKEKDGDDKKADEDKKPDESKAEKVRISTTSLGTIKPGFQSETLTMSAQKAEEEEPAEEEPRVFALHRSAQLPSSHGSRHLQVVHLTQLQDLPSEPGAPKMAGQNGQTEPRTDSEPKLFPIRARGRSMRNLDGGPRPFGRDRSGDSSADEVNIGLIVHVCTSSKISPWGVIGVM